MSLVPYGGGHSSRPGNDSTLAIGKLATELTSQLDSKNVGLMDVLPIHTDGMWYHPLACRALDRERVLISTFSSRSADVQEFAQVLQNNWRRICQSFYVKFHRSLVMKSDDLASLAFTPLPRDAGDGRGGSAGYWNKTMLLLALNDRLLWYHANSNIASIENSAPSNVITMPGYDSSVATPSEDPILQPLYKAHTSWMAYTTDFLRDFADRTSGHDFISETRAVALAPAPNSDPIADSLFTSVERGEKKIASAKAETAFCQAALGVRAVLQVRGLVGRTLCF